MGALPVRVALVPSIRDATHEVSENRRVPTRHFKGAGQRARSLEVTTRAWSRGSMTESVSCPYCRSMLLADLPSWDRLDHPTGGRPLLAAMR